MWCITNSGVKITDLNLRFSATFKLGGPSCKTGDPNTRISKHLRKKLHVLGKYYLVYNVNIFALKPHKIHVLLQKQQHWSLTFK